MPDLTPDAVLLFAAPSGAVGAGSGSLALLALYVVLAICVSFLCSVLEAVLLSVTPAYVGALAETKPAAAQRLRTLKADVDRPLAVILSLNTVAHTIGAAGAGAEAAAYWGDAAIGVFSGVLTLHPVALRDHPQDARRVRRVRWRRRRLSLMGPRPRLSASGLRSDADREQPI